MEDLGLTILFIIDGSESTALVSNIRTLQAITTSQSIISELVIIQNGEGNSRSLEDAKQVRPDCEIIRYQHKQAYGVALKRGIHNSNLPFILVMDASVDVSIESINLMLRTAQHADMVIGRRFGRRAGFRETFGAWLWSKLALLLFSIDVDDVDCTVKLIRRATLHDIGYLESHGELFNTELLARMIAANARVYECPLQMVRKAGQKGPRLGLLTIAWLIYQLTKLFFHMRRVRRWHEDESAFHDKWAQTIDVSTMDVPLNFTAITAAENRHALELMGDLRGKRFLDLGCGAGETSVFFATQGAQVTAVDISEKMIQNVQALARRYNVQVEASVMLAESLDYPDETFDIVFGNGVLHHTYRPAAYAEVHRILKPGGLGVFIEPLAYNPLLWIYRRIAHEVRTEGEKPFSFRDFIYLRKIFPHVSHREFWLFSLAIFLRMFLIEHLHPARVRYWKHIITHSNQYEDLYKRLRAWDDSVLTRFPFLGAFAWNTVIQLRKVDDVQQS